MLGIVLQSKTDFAEFVQHNSVLNCVIVVLALACFLSIAGCLQIPMIICLGAAFFRYAPSCLDNRFALQSSGRGFQISGSFNGIITNVAATDYSIAFPLQLFLGLLPNRFASSACVLWILSSHTVFITNKVPFRTGNIIMQNRPFQISKWTLPQICTVRSLAKIGQVKCAACA